MAKIQLSRRFALLTIVTVLSGSSMMGSALHSAEKTASTELVYIGMHGTQIHAARFNPDNGNIAMIAPVATNPRPTWAVPHPNKPIVYFDDNSGEAGKSEGGVQALKIDAKTGALSEIGNVRAGGAGTTHLWLDRPSMTILAANYSGGSITTMRILPDGTLSAPVSVIKLIGSGPHQRQTSPHAHAVAVDPSGKFALVADLGSDRVWAYPFDRKTGKLGAEATTSTRHYSASPGSGPRHFVFHPGGRKLYLINELTAEIEVLGWNAKSGQLTALQKVPTNASDFTGTTSAAEIAISADGRFVYSSNRGDHALVVHSVNKKTGKLYPLQRIASGGLLPWHFAIHKSGKWMLVSNRDSDTVNVFSIDRRTGMLTDSKRSLRTPKPVFSIFTGE